MKTVSLLKKDFNSLIVTVDGTITPLVIVNANVYISADEIVTLSISSPDKKFELNLDASEDDITISGSAFEGTAAELKTAIESDISSGLVSSQVVIYQRKTILTHAQILALSETPVELVPAPGEGKLLVLQKAIWAKKEHTAPYAGWSQGDVILIIYQGGEIDASHGAYDMNAIPGSGYSALGALLANLSGLENSTWVDYPASISNDELVNLPLIDKNGVGENKAFMAIHYSSTLTGGHADNTIEVTVFYSIVDL